MVNELPWNSSDTIPAILSSEVNNHTSRFHSRKHLIIYNQTRNCNPCNQLTSSVMSFGAGLPGIKAVVITISTSRHCSKKSFISASMNSLDISFAYPPAPEPSSSISTSMNSAPRDWTCSRAAGRVSNPRVIAPSRRA